jgi:putative nucleotidyltransferase with HDIG domain
VPTALAATYICAFIGHRVAIIAMANTILIAALLAPNPSEFIVLNMMTGMIAIFFAKNNHRRSALYWCVIAIFAVYSALHIALLLIHNGSIENLAAEDIFHFALNAGLVLAGYQLIFSLEKIFGYTSNATLIEIADTNQPLLRLLAEKAPATFQHSVQVAALAETAAVIIGANPLLARAGALYHDIGKMLNPSYFIENQVHGYNPHTHLAAEESAKIIIGHVSDGIAIAHKYRLPKTIVDFIPTHHGNSKTRYFYRIYKETHPAACDFSAFTYPGRNPHTREEAVVMLSDVVEASSRTLAQYSPKNIDQIVESAIDNVLADGVLKESPLTFADIYAIKSAFKKKLQNIYHARALE